MSRLLLFLLLGSLLYGWQHQERIQEWWAKQSGSVPVAGIELLVVADCCGDAEAFFARSGVPHRVRRLDMGSSASLHDGPFPVIRDGKRKLHGFDAELLQQWYVERPRNAARLAAAGMPADGAEVLLFATDWCPYCAAARAHFTARGISWRELDVERDPAAAALQQSLSGSRAVPLIIFDNMMLRGFSAQRFDVFRQWSRDA